MHNINLIGLMDHETNAGFQMFPYGIARLASLTPKKFNVNVYNILDINEEIEDADLYGISVMTPVANKAYKLADKLRKKGKKVILGGIHVSMLPTEAIKHADSVVSGEVESVWKNILTDYEKGKLQKFYQCQRPNLEKLPLIKKEHFGDTKARFKIIQSTQGCPFGCDFCSVALYNGTKFRHVPVKDVVKQTKELKTRFNNLFSFVDDNIVADPRYAKELFKALKPLKITWVAQASITIANNKELLRLARESGCFAVIVGFESIQQDSLNDVHKRYKVEEYEEKIKMIKDAGIMVFGSFVFGFDHDKKEDFDKTLDFCIKNDIEIVSFHPLTPFPGTALYRRLKKQKRINTYKWEKYNWRHIVIKPKLMTEKELARGIARIFREFYSLKHVSRRLLKTLAKGRLKHFLLLSIYYFSTRKHLKGVYSSLRA